MEMLHSWVGWDTVLFCCEEVMLYTYHPWFSECGTGSVALKGTISWSCANNHLPSLCIFRILFYLGGLPFVWGHKKCIQVCASHLVAVTTLRECASMYSSWWIKLGFAWWSGSKPSQEQTDQEPTNEAVHNAHFCVGISFSAILPVILFQVYCW